MGLGVFFLTKPKCPKKCEPPTHEEVKDAVKDAADAADEARKAARKDHPDHPINQDIQDVVDSINEAITHMDLNDPCAAAEKLNTSVSTNKTHIDVLYTHDPSEFTTEMKAAIMTAGSNLDAAHKKAQHLCENTNGGTPDTTPEKKPPVTAT